MRRILVTGANKGIGLAITIAILERDADTSVVLGSRSLERGSAALASIVEAHPEWASRLQLLELDVSSGPSVERAAAELKASFVGEQTPLLGIVNNAGVALGSNELQAMFNVNVFGIHRVCQAFMSLLDSGSGRIVNITSASGPNFVSGCSQERQEFLTDRNIEWSTLQGFMEDCVNTGDGLLATIGLTDGEDYGLTKACANSYTMWFARENPQFHVNACTPGWIETDMTRPGAESGGKTGAELGMSPPSEGTRSAMYLMFDDPEGNGRYYGSDAVRSPLDRYRAPGSPPFLGE